MGVIYDSRIENGELDLPGFPGEGNGIDEWTLRCWRVTETQ